MTEEKRNYQVAGIWFEKKDDADKEAYRLSIKNGCPATVLVYRSDDLNKKIDEYEINHATDHLKVFKPAPYEPIIHRHFKIINDLKEMRDTLVPVYNKYPSQSQPQPAMIEIDCDAKTVWAGFDDEIGNAVPINVYHGRTLRYEISSYVKGSDLADMLDSREFTELVNRILAGYTKKWDGSNHKGILNEDASNASDALDEWASKTSAFDADVWEH